MSISNGVLCVCPLELDFFNNSDLNTENMFCVFLVGDKLLTSELSQTSEGHPTWKKHIINAELASDRDFVIYVYEKAKDFSEVLVGEATITLDCAKEGGFARPWIDLEDIDGNKNGRIRLQMEFLSNIPSSNIEEYIEAVNMPLEEKTSMKEKPEDENIKIKSKPKKHWKNKASAKTTESSQEKIMDKGDTSTKDTSKSCDDMKLQKESKGVQMTSNEQFDQSKDVKYRASEFESQGQKGVETEKSRTNMRA